jgi:hypothetical protein
MNIMSPAISSTTRGASISCMFLQLFGDSWFFSCFYGWY